MACDVTQTTLEALVAEAARLDRILQSGRDKVSEGQAIIDATISDYVSARNRLSAFVDGLVRVSANGR